jgi:hypothetical protein
MSIVTRLSAVVGVSLSLSLAPSAHANPAAADAPAVEPKKSDPSVVTLKNPGAEPRHELRYAFKAGFEQRVETSIKTKNEGEVPTPPMPRMITTSSYTVSKVEDGRASITFTLDDHRIDPADKDGDDSARQMLTDTLKSMNGASGRFTMDAQGRSFDATFDPGAGMDPAVAATMKGFLNSTTEMVVALPKEPVGVGAVWTVEQQRDVGIMTARVVSTYTVTKVDAGGFDANVAMAMSIPGQEMKIPGTPMPEGFKTHLQDSTGEATSTLTVRLDRPLPTAMSVRSVMDIKVKVTTPHGDQEMAQKSSSEMDLREVTAPADAPSR